MTRDTYAVLRTFRRDRSDPAGLGVRPALTQKGTPSEMFRAANKLEDLDWSIESSEGRLIEDSNGWYELHGELRTYGTGTDLPVDSSRLKMRESPHVRRGFSPDECRFATCAANVYQIREGTTTLVSACTTEYGLLVGSQFIFGLFTSPRYRGQGLARTLMEKLCSLADEQGVDLYLLPEPFADEQADESSLRAFYTSLGFVVDKSDEANPNLMRRDHRGKEEDNEEEAVSEEDTIEADSAGSAE